MAETIEQTNRLSKLSRQPQGDDDDSLDVLQILGRQRWLIAFLAIAGLATGIAYAFNAQVWYESHAEVLINQKSAGLGGDSSGTDVVDADILANHMQLLRSRMIIGEALQEHDLLELPSVVSHLDENRPDFDAIDYVIKHLKLSKGGTGRPSPHVV